MKCAHQTEPWLFRLADPVVNSLPGRVLIWAVVIAIAGPVLLAMVLAYLVLVFFCFVFGFYPM